MSDHVDQISDRMRNEMQACFARDDDVMQLTDEELIARADDPEVGYEGGAAQFVRDVETDWAT